MATKPSLDVDLIIQTFRNICQEIWSLYILDRRPLIKEIGLYKWVLANLTCPQKNFLNQLRHFNNPQFSPEIVL